MSDYTESLRPAIVALYRDGVSQTEIANALHIGKKTVYDALVGVEKQRACHYCGKMFTVPRSAAGANFYCSPECRAMAQKRNKAIYRQKKRTPPHISSTLDETVRAADAAGMSYGKYVEMRRKKNRP